MNGEIVILTLTKDLNMNKTMPEWCPKVCDKQNMGRKEIYPSFLARLLEEA
jgi:hypothetical protein